MSTQSSLGKKGSSSPLSITISTSSANSNLRLRFSDTPQESSPPLISGCLSPAVPILVRGRVYCGTDFRRRAVDWFASQKNTRAVTANKETSRVPTTKVSKRTPRRREFGAPTRVQPTRAAKRKAATLAGPAVGGVLPSKTRSLALGAASITTASNEDYTLDKCWADVSEAEFQTIVETLLLKKANQANARSRTGGALAYHERGWCPVAAKPLACTEMAYCLHGIGRRDHLRPVCVPKMPLSPWPSELPEAHMSRGRSPSCSPPPHCNSEKIDREAEVLRHVDGGIEDLGGLKCAVDACNGAVRVWML
ncbi:hypothetical protein SPI_02581 [Niveomyces insectorum RCEF 264]|uniref:Uncharacterized protein n=1 Tax=Niveomyces insectorum RCEF 264 TaxID=1081102 RepID=A0A167Y3P3_9HYPO|nr:hypothetical protein SPI_02581 [Niveomyces insectorum RCEF 264]